MTTYGTQSLPAGAAQHVEGEFVVDGDHARFVLDLLGGAGRISDEIPALNLTLIAVKHVEAATRALADGLGSVPSPAAASPLDGLLAMLRSASARGSSGWYPTMGKNRVVMGPQAYPYFSPKDEPADGPAPVPATSLAAAPAAGGEGCGVVVGVLDTRVIRHPFYADAVRFIGNSEIASADVSQAWQAHGTFVTGLVHAQAPDAEILVRAVLTGEDGVASAWDAAKGLVDLVQSGAHVVNMALGCVTRDDRPPFAIRAAVERLRDRVVLVAAAGNYARGATPPSWPAALDGVLAVGSEAAPDARSWFSPEQPWVDLVAVGEGVTSTFAGSPSTPVTVEYQLLTGGLVYKDFTGAASWSGTSFAAAVVSGRIATLASASGYPSTGLSLQTLARQLRDKRYPGDAVARTPKW